MGESQSTHTIKVSVDPTSLEEVAKEIMWTVRAEVARDVLFKPLLGLAEQVYLLGIHVVRGFGDEDPNSPLTAVVLGVADTLEILIAAVEDAKQVAEWQGATKEVEAFRLKAGALPALEPLLLLTKRLSSLASRTAAALDGLDEDDPRADAAKAISPALGTLTDAIEHTKNVFAALQEEGDDLQVEGS